MTAGRLLPFVLLASAGCAPKGAGRADSPATWSAWAPGRVALSSSCELSEPQLLQAETPWKPDSLGSPGDVLVGHGPGGALVLWSHTRQGTWAFALGEGGPPAALFDDNVVRGSLLPLDDERWLLVGAWLDADIRWHSAAWILGSEGGVLDGPEALPAGSLLGVSSLVGDRVIVAIRGRGGLNTEIWAVRTAHGLQLESLDREHRLLYHEMGTHLHPLDDGAWVAFNPTEMIHNGESIELPDATGRRMEFVDGSRILIVDRTPGALTARIGWVDLQTRASEFPEEPVPLESLPDFVPLERGAVYGHAETDAYLFPDDAQQPVDPDTTLVFRRNGQSWLVPDNRSGAETWFGWMGDHYLLIYESADPERGLLARELRCP